MEYIRIKNDGTIEHHFAFRDNNDDLVPKVNVMEKNANLIPFFSNWIEIDKGFTLYSFYRVLLKYPQLQSIDPMFQPYIEQFKEFKNKKEIRKVDEEAQSIHKLAVQNIYDVTLSDCEIKMEKTPEIRNGNVYYKVETRQIPKHKLEIDTYKRTDCLGIGFEEDKEQSYSISFTNPISIIDRPIEIRPPQTMFTGVLETHESGDIKHYSPYQHDKALKEMTLYDFIFSICNEICFHGGPEESQEVLDDLRERTEQVREDMKASEKENDEENDNGDKD